MPEQASARALPITTSGFEQPFDTEVFPYGSGGLNLRDQLDAIPVGQFAKLNNFIHTMDRGLRVRDGLTTLATAGTVVHSARRLNVPLTQTFTRVWGIDGNLYIGQSGALASIDTGYSGDPLTLLTHRTTLSGDPWMFVGDRARMRKVRSDGLDLPIGLPAPGAAATSALGNLYTTSICGFDSTDGSNQNNWSKVAGFDRSTPPIQANTPFAVDVPGMQGQAVSFVTVAGGAQTAYASWWGLARSLDLTKLQGGIRTASDEDLFHTWIRMFQPELIEEIRIYLVCSGTFNANILPGTDTLLQQNGDAYMKVFRQNDLTQAIQAKQSMADASETQRIRALRDQSLKDSTTIDTRLSTQTISANRAPIRSVGFQAGSGSGEWVQFGVLGVPVRRGDFQRIGSTAGRDWSTITGIIIYISALPGVPSGVSFTLDDMFLYGGDGPDTTNPGDQQYDYRYTNYDPRTGAESNGSPTMGAAAFIDASRREIDVGVAAFGDAAMRQRVYRRGGTNISDWFFLGVNGGDGSTFVDLLTDDAISAAGTLPDNHFQPVPTFDTNGNTILAQPVPVIFGPINGILFALGDPNRPGHLYNCIADQPDHWPDDFVTEVCSPSEELMTGFMFVDRGFCFSREKLYAIYPGLTSTGVSATPTACRRGVISRWAYAIGLGGIYFVSKDGIYVTAGGQEEPVSVDIQRLFQGIAWNGYSPVDTTVPTAIRLAINTDTLFFLYQGLDGNRHVLAYSLIFKYWRNYDFQTQLAMIANDDESQSATLLLGGTTSGKAYTHTGQTDDGAAIPWLVRTGTWDLGRPRIDKLLGDQILDADLQGIAGVTFQNRLDNETVVNAVQVIETAAAGRKRYIFDSFGTTPQRARNLSVEISGNSSGTPPTLYFFGQSVIAEPDVTINRMTQWDDLGKPDESYVTGVTFDCDTQGIPRTIIVERDFGGVITTMATLLVNTPGRRKVKFSWLDPTNNHGFQAHKVRIRPNDDCRAWILYKADWISVAEPPRIAHWDIHFEADGDQYYTGVDLFCDTVGAEKQIVVEIDGVVLTNPYTLEPFWRITTAHRTWVHLTLPNPLAAPGRGHVFHLYAQDNNDGILYRHKWYTDAEPSEQANWNQNFNEHGTLADKWFKGFVLLVDTFGQNKTVQVQLDNVVVETFQVNTVNRTAVHHSFDGKDGKPTQFLGRVLRVYPVDGNPSRPYEIIPIFDQEPYQFTHWETQETDHDLSGFFTPIDAMITLRSTADVTFITRIYTRQPHLGEDPTQVPYIDEPYTVASTGGIKNKRYVPFVAHKGVLIKYRLLSTTTAPFHLFQEESSVRILPWGADQPREVHPFGNDDQDRTREMVVASTAATRSGGGSA